MNFMHVVEMQFITLMPLFCILQIDRKMESNLTPISGQDSTSNSHSIKARPTQHESVFLKKCIQMEGKFSYACIAKRLLKVGEFID